MESYKGAQYIAKAFKAYGVSHVFYVLAILRHGLTYLEEEGIKRITAHSEKGAAYMADGYARISRKPGVAMAQSVGAANLAAGLQDAYLGHSPVIAITGRKPPLFQYRNAYQEIVHGPMYDAVTKFNANVDTGAQLPILLRQAFREATSGAPRPVHLDLAGLTGEVIEKEIVAGPLAFEPEYARCPSHRFTPPDEELAEAIDLIRAASRPVMVYGSGAACSDCGPEMMELSRRFAIPLAFSCHGKALVPDSYELTAGSVGSYSCQSANRIVSLADLVIYIGSGTGDQVTLDWSIPADAVKKIQIDIDPSQLGRNYANTFGLLGDARDSLRRLIGHLGEEVRKEAWAAEARRIIGEYRASVEPLRNSAAVPIRPERLCKEISGVLPANAIIVADTGYSAIWACSMIETTSMGQTSIRAAGSLGWAFPAALGAKCAAPERPVICFAGDGALMYHLTELETAKRWGINTVTVVNNNSAFAQSIVGIDKAYGGKRGNKEEVYLFNPVNFANLAREFGCFGIRVTDPAAIAGAIRQALASGLPAIVDVVTDHKCAPCVAWKP